MIGPSWVDPLHHERILSTLATTQDFRDGAILLKNDQVQRSIAIAPVLFLRRIELGDIADNRAHIQAGG
jgi:hypothetical protein